MSDSDGSDGIFPTISIHRNLQFANSIVMPPRRACDVCYKRKIQCSIVNPDEPCEWCSHHNLACTFARDRRQKSTTTTVILNDVKELFRRVETLERALQDATQHLLQTQNEVTQGSTVSTTPTVQRANSTETATPEQRPLASANPSPFVAIPHAIPHDPQCRSLHDVKQYLGQNWYHKGIPILSERGHQWITLKTGKTAAFNQYHLFGSKRFALQPLPSIQVPLHELCELPCKGVAQEIFSAYFKSSFRLRYPVLDASLLEETMAAAYHISESVPLSPTSNSARLCILAALSVLGRVKEFEPFANFVRYNECAAQAQCLLPFIEGSSSLEGLQAVLLLQMYRTFNGEWENAVALHSMACRIIFDLGGHFYSPVTPDRASIARSERQNRQLRLLFWVAYVFDKDISLRSGQPPLLTRDYCDLTPPHCASSRYGCASGEVSRIENSACDEITLHLPGDLRLSYIKEKACHLLFSPRAFSLSDTELLHYIRQLDDELESWRLSIPLDFRPKLSIASAGPLFPPDSRIPPYRRSMKLHLQLEYHYLVTSIHTTVRRCGAAYAEVPDLPDDLHNVFHSSSDLSLEASRSTLSLFKDTSSFLEEEEFWNVAFYPPVAAMSLFLNVLLHPLNAQVQVDLEILASTANLFQNFSIRALTDDEIDYIQEMNRFVTELVRLGSGAIWKAKKEQRNIPSPAAS